MPSYVAHAPGEGPAEPEQEPSRRTSNRGAALREHFFGTLAPKDMPIQVHGQTWTVRLRVLERDESRRAAAFAYERADGRVEGDDYLIALDIARIAFMLEAVDGVAISSEARTPEERVQLAASLYDTLADEIRGAYEQLRLEPLALLSEMVDDQDFADTPTASGSSPVGEGYPQED